MERGGGTLDLGAVGLVVGFMIMVAIGVFWLLLRRRRTGRERSSRSSTSAFRIWLKTNATIPAMSSGMNRSAAQPAVIHFQLRDHQLRCGVRLGIVVIGLIFILHRRWGEWQSVNITAP